MKIRNKLSLSKSKLGTYLAVFALAAGFLGITADVDAQQRGARVNDRQVERIIRNIEQKSDTFRRSFDPALDRSRLDGTYTEDQINQFIKSFEDATNDLRSRFNGRTAVASDVENVLNRAAVIDRFMQTNLRQRQIQNNWASLRNDLNRLAVAYNVTFDWGGGLMIVLAVFSADRANGQTVGKDPPETKPTVSATVMAPAIQATPAPLFTAYKSITIGLTADEVKQKLGKPMVDDKDGFFYEISDDEFVQIRLDNERKIRLIAVTYTSKNKAAPMYGEVFGGVEPTSNADGSIYNLVRYPSAGYWVAYSRSGGDSPTITVTMQKL